MYYKNLFFDYLFSGLHLLYLLQFFILYISVHTYIYYNIMLYYSKYCPNMTSYKKQKASTSMPTVVDIEKPVEGKTTRSLSLDNHNFVKNVLYSSFHSSIFIRRKWSIPKVCILLILISLTISRLSKITATNKLRTIFAMTLSACKMPKFLPMWRIGGIQQNKWQQMAPKIRLLNVKFPRQLQSSLPISD